MTMPDPEELLRRLQHRDPEAQAHFRRVMRPRLLALAMREMRVLARAEDVTEDVLTAFLFGQVDGLRSARAVDRYLRVAVRRRCQRVRTVESRYNHLPDAMESPGGVDPIAALDAPRVQSRLAHCLTQLTERARAMLRMRYHEDMTNAEIGRIFGFSGQYASRVLGKALAALRRCMEPVA